jgi:hypothetical protein
MIFPQVMVYDLVPNTHRRTYLAVLALWGPVGNVLGMHIPVTAMLIPSPLNTAMDMLRILLSHLQLGVLRSRVRVDTV